MTISPSDHVREFDEERHRDNLLKLTAKAVALADMMCDLTIASFGKTDGLVRLLKLSAETAKSCEAASNLLRAINCK